MGHCGVPVDKGDSAVNPTGFRKSRGLFHRAGLVLLTTDLLLFEQSRFFMPMVTVFYLILKRKYAKKLE